MTTDVYAKVTGLFAPTDPRSLRRLLKSRDQRCPRLKLLVAGESGEHPPGVSAVRIPDDAPLPTRLNSLLARVTTPYCLVLPEGAQWPRRPRLEAMLRPLIEDHADLVSGSTLYCRRGWTLLTSKVRPQEHARLVVSGDAARFEPATAASVDGLAGCDIGSPYFAARTSDLRRIGGWDDSLTPHEQLELYVRAKQFDLRTRWAPTAVLRVWSKTLPGQTPLSEQAVVAMGYTALTDLEGRQTHAPSRAAAA